MPTFKLKPEGFKEVRKKVLTRTIPLFILLISASIYISSFNQNTDTSTVDILPIFIPIVVIALCLSLWKALKKQKHLWDTYLLSIDNGIIVRTQDNVPTVIIEKNQLQEIVSSSQGNFMLKTAQKVNFINIPHAIENREELLTLLQTFDVPNTNGKESNWQGLVTGLVTLVLMVICFTSVNPYIVTPTGVLLTIGLIWSFFEMRKSKTLDKKTKRVAYFVFFIVLGIVGRIIGTLGLFAN